MHHLPGVMFYTVVLPVVCLGTRRDAPAYKDCLDSHPLLDLKDPSNAPVSLQ